jgi:hypothetical protein
VPGIGLLSHGFPAWDSTVLGAAGHANALFYSALAPVALVGLLYGWRRARGVLAGFACGVAAHLLFYLFWNVADIRYVPNLFYLDQIWLVLNAALAFGLAYIVARK